MTDIDLMPAYDAAARALYAEAQRAGQEPIDAPFDSRSLTVRDRYRTRGMPAVRATAPIVARQAWEDGYYAATDDSQKPYGQPITPNPHATGGHDE